MLRFMFRIIWIILICTSSIIAQDEIDTVTYSLDLDDYVITAQYEPTHYKEALHRVDIIKKETITQIGAVTLEQALVVSPAIRLYEDPILGTSIRMRGLSASNVAILIDGVPMIGRNNGSIDLSQISLSNVERIEIVEGPLSNLYGNNAAGGVINIITKKSQTRSWNINQTNQLESLGQRNHTASIGYQKGKINVGVQARCFNYDQFGVDSLRIIDKDTISSGVVINRTRYPFNPKTQKSYGTYVRYNINEDDYLLAKYDYNQEEVIDYGIIKRPQFNPYALDQFYDTRRKDASIAYNAKVKDHLFINLVSSYNQYERIRDDKRYYTESMTFDSLLQSSDSISFGQVFGRGNFNYTGWNNWTIGGGYSYTRESGKGDRLLDRTDVDSLFTSFTESAIYTDIKYEGIQCLQLSLGNRFTMHSTYDNAITTSIQAKYIINKKLSFRSSFSQGYRSPSLKELYLEFVDINHNIIGNEELQPERSYDIQSTLNYTHSKAIEVSLNGYYTNIKNRISLTEYETLKFIYDNIDKYSVYGFQPSIQYNKSGLTINSNASLGYWATNINRSDAPAYGRVIDVNNKIKYEWTKKKWSVLINHRYIGSQPMYRLSNEEVQLSTIEGYNMLDMSFSKSLWKRSINITAGVRNVLDIKTIQVIGGSSGIHSSIGRNTVSLGRSLFLGVKFGFLR